MTKRTKTELTVTITKSQATEAFSAYAAADAELDEINAKLDIEFNKLRDAHSIRITELTAIKTGQLSILKAFATTNRELFKTKKSMDFAFGRIGFRIGTPALKLMSGFKSWDKVKELVKQVLPDYIRTTEEVAKDLLIADRNDLKVSDKFTQCGIKVSQTETFFVEPKKEVVEAAA